MSIAIVVFVVLLYCYYAMPRVPTAPPITENFPNTPYTVPYMRELISPTAWQGTCLYQPYPMQVQTTYTMT